MTTDWQQTVLNSCWHNLTAEIEQNLLFRKHLKGTHHLNSYTRFDKF